MFQVPLCVTQSNIGDCHSCPRILKVGFRDRRPGQLFKPFHSAPCLIFVRLRLFQRQLKRLQIHPSQRAALGDRRPLVQRQFDDLSTDLKRQINGSPCNNLAKENAL